MTTLKTFLQDFREILLSSNQTQRDLAKSVGANESTLGHWWNGTATPSLYLTISLLDVLGYDLEIKPKSQTPKRQAVPLGRRAALIQRNYAVEQAARFALRVYDIYSPIYEPTDLSTRLAEGGGRLDYLVSRRIQSMVKLRKRVG